MSKPDLKILKLKQRADEAPDNGVISGTLRNMADKVDDYPQVSAAGVVLTYADGAVGTLWVGDADLDLLKALAMLRIRIERTVD